MAVEWVDPKAQRRDQGKVTKWELSRVVLRVNCLAASWAEHLVLVKVAEMAPAKALRWWAAVWALA
jgi:hypothetical protein